MAKVKTKAMSCPIPDNDVDVTNFIRRIGEKQNEITRLEAIKSDKVLELKDNLEKAIAPIKAEMKDLEKGVFAFCSTNRKRLTNNNKVKNANFRTGTVNWRFGTSCSVKSMEAVIERLKNNRLKKFITVKESLDKNLMLQNQSKFEKIEGISFNTKEVFTIEITTKKTGEQDGISTDSNE